MSKKERDVPTPNERASYPEARKKPSTDKQSIKRLSAALLDTGLFGEEAIALLEAGSSDDKIRKAIDDFRQKLHPVQLRPEIKYVLGIVFDYDQTHVLLIWKLRPLWQAGKLNGIGGKIEEGELPHSAMVRKFAEETGICDTKHAGIAPVTTESLTWMYVGKRYREALYDLQPGSYEMFIYTAHLPLEVMRKAQYHNKDEEIICLPLNMEILRRRGVPGLAWTVDAALCSMTEGFYINVEDPPFLEALG